MIKRWFDILFSSTMLVILAPILFLLAAWVALDSRGGIFFSQERIGLKGKPFMLRKFRTMRPMAEQQGQLTVGSTDKRITRAGYYLRKYKVDELPQLWNVLVGEMSVVGPRPEVPRYVAMYTAEQRSVLNVRPGITDYASLQYFKENDLLAASDNPENTYIQEIMPAKLQLNLEYVRSHTLTGDLKIILLTGLRILRV